MLGNTTTAPRAAQMPGCPLFTFEVTWVSVGHGLLCARHRGGVLAFDRAEGTAGILGVGCKRHYQ